MSDECKLQVGFPLPRTRMGKQARELVWKFRHLRRSFPVMSQGCEGYGTMIYAVWYDTTKCTVLRYVPLGRTRYSQRTLAQASVPAAHASERIFRLIRLNCVSQQGARRLELAACSSQLRHVAAKCPSPLLPKTAQRSHSRTRLWLRDHFAH